MAAAGVVFGVAHAPADAVATAVVRLPVLPIALRAVSSESEAARQPAQGAQEGSCREKFSTVATSASFWGVRRRKGCLRTPRTALVRALLLPSA